MYKLGNLKYYIKKNYFKEKNFLSVPDVIWFIYECDNVIVYL